MRVRAFLLAAMLIPTEAMAQQNFSCRFGTQGACLDYGDTICSSLGKCVDANAKCFASYQCDYEGFTCKSNLTDCAEEYDALQTRYNRLVDDYNDLLEDSQNMRAAFQSALDDLEATQDALASTRLTLVLTREDLDARQRDLRQSEDALLDLQLCVENLGRFEDASICLH